jgi:hypothetical protein
MRNKVCEVAFGVVEVKLYIISAVEDFEDQTYPTREIIYVMLE